MGKNKKITMEEIAVMRKNNTEFFTNLQNAKEQDILSENEVQEKITMKREQIIKEHEKSRKIWQGTGKDKRWFTRLPDAGDNGKGTRIAKANRSDLENEIVKFYSEQKGILTIRKLYPEFLKQKELEKVADTTYVRFQTTWNKYFKNDSELVDKDITKLTKGFCKKWVLNLLNENPMNRKCYDNIKTIPKQILEMATEYEYISCNYFKELTIPRKCFVEKAKDDEDDIFNHEEVKLLIKHLWKRFETKPSYTAPLAILFAFQTGLRVGELTAIKFSDIDENNELLVQRQQVRDRDKVIGKLRGYKFTNDTKSQSRKNRVYVPEEARYILEVLRQANEANGDGADGFVFYNRHGYMTPAVLDRLIERSCEKVGIKPRRMHAVRKTYASILYEAGISEALM